MTNNQMVRLVAKDYQRKRAISWLKRLQEKQEAKVLEEAENSQLDAKSNE